MITDGSRDETGLGFFFLFCFVLQTRNSSSRNETDVILMAVWRPLLSAIIGPPVTIVPCVREQPRISCAVPQEENAYCRFGHWNDYQASRASSPACNSLWSRFRFPDTESDIFTVCMAVHECVNCRVGGWGMGRVRREGRTPPLSSSVVSSLFSQTKVVIFVHIGSFALISTHPPSRPPIRCHDMHLRL